MPNGAVKLVAQYLESNTKKRSVLEILMADASHQRSHELIGTTLGKYRIERVLGSGGMGVVLLATDKVLRRRVAIKLMHEHFSDDPTMSKRFLAEARNCAKCSHPNIVPIHDVCQFDGQIAIVSEFIEGSSADKVIQKQGKFNWQIGLDIVFQISQALQAAHQNGIVHRDVKPSNILLQRQGNQIVAKLTDFGIASLLDSHSTRLTTDGSVPGTPHFMSPEQCRGESLDSRSDLYSLGATLFLFLTGHCPFEKEQAMQVLFAHCSEPLAPPSHFEPSVSAECDQIVIRAMQKQPSKRFANADAMASSITTTLSARPPDREPAALSTIQPVSVDAPRPTVNPSQPIRIGTSPPRHKGWAVLIGGLLVAGVAGIASVAWITGGNRTEGNHFGSPTEQNIPTTRQRSLATTDAPEQLSENWAKPPFAMRLWGDALSIATSSATLNNPPLIAWSIQDSNESASQLFVFDLDDGHHVASALIEREYASIVGIRFIPDSSLVLFGESQSLYSLNLETSEVVRLVTIELANIVSTDVSADGHAVAVTTDGWDKNANRVLTFDIEHDADTPKLITQNLQLPETKSELGAVAFSKSGRYLAWGADDRNVWVYEFGTGNVRSKTRPKPDFDIASPESANFYARSISFSGDKYLAASGDVRPFVWDVETGDQRLVASASEFPVSSVAFEPDSNTLSVGTADGIVLVDIETEQRGQYVGDHQYNIIDSIIWLGRSHSKASNHSKHSQSSSESEDCRIVSLGEDNQIRFHHVQKEHRPPRRQPSRPRSTAPTNPNN